MPLSHTASYILYVPFSKEYTVSFEKISELDMDTFFQKCFVKPHLSDDIEILKSLPENEIGDPEYPLKRDDIIRKYDEEIIRRDSFLDWMNGHGDGIYLLRGDAGTGKTTYVHYLKWKLSKIRWEILDLKEAGDKIRVIGQRIKIKKFGSLYGKVIACILQKITSSIFIMTYNQKLGWQCDFAKAAERLQILLSNYKARIQPAEPYDEYGVLYRSLNAVHYPDAEHFEEYCRECAHIFSDYFMKRCALCEDQSDALECAITHFMIILKCFSKSKKKTIMVLDNLERFIGVHEIYSNELIKFIRNLRRIVDSYKNEFFYSEENRNLFAENFQFIVAMRNTSARGFTPRQSADFFEGSVDLSEWFSIGEIISNKLAWYESKGCTLDNAERLRYIMKDFGIAEGGVIRGLRPKLNLIFNYNKRLTVEFLVEILESVSNESVLKVSDELRNERFGERNKDGGLASFAYRSVIWRLLIEKLNRGGMFRYIFNEKHPQEDSYVDMNYIRNILTILSNYSLEHNDVYMPIEEMIRILYHINGNPVMWFDNWAYATERSKVAKLLYYMNYYNRRENNWFQFVDIQCNDASYDNHHFENWEEILKMIETKNKAERKIGIRITNAGKAYVGYIVQTFEFVSCMEGISSPLLCCLPTEDDLLSINIDSLPCVQIINQVMQGLKHYTQNDDLRIKYERNDRAGGYSYTARIINAHVGYLDNFWRCVDRTINSTDRRIIARKGELGKKIKEITDTYRKSSN